MNIDEMIERVLEGEDIRSVIEASIDPRGEVSIKTFKGYFENAIKNIKGNYYGKI